ncbi:MAG: iron-containing alcohol dehydrogenase family protein [Clostridia bacterium]|nr:iron-containing alcohol dehydrogenase family protein [Clostridia bacterium]
MSNYSILLPAYSIGESVLERVGEVCSPWGRRAVLIGGERALGAIGEKLMECARRDGRIEVMGPLLYGGEASLENVHALMDRREVREADMIFAAGGGKALDTCKVLGDLTGKPVFTFPTIASTCAATTAVAIVYHPDGRFDHPHFLPGPARHAFIDTTVIASAPPRYLWAGLGDTYAKYFESTMSSRLDELNHYHALGVVTSQACLMPLLRYGEAAMEAHRQQRVTPELEQVILAIIVTTGIASILLTADRIIDYNTGLAHAVFYALTGFPELELEKHHLHGEVVGFGVLILLLVDGQRERFEEVYRFNRSVGLPTSPEEIGVSRDMLKRVIPCIPRMADVAHNPYPITESMLIRAFDELEIINSANQ